MGARAPPSQDGLSEDSPAGGREKILKFTLQQVFAIWINQTYQGIQVSSVYQMGVYLVRHFYSKEDNEAKIGSMAGILAASFSGAQFTTSYSWGAISDRIGRKPVVVVANLTTGLAVVALGLAPTFWVAVAARALGGAFNGSGVAIKTMVAESCSATQQARGMAVITLGWGMGNIFGPMIAGLLSQPCERWPRFPLCDGGNGLFAQQPFLPACLAIGAIAILATLCNSYAMPETHPRFRRPPPSAAPLPTWWRRRHVGQEAGVKGVPDAEVGAPKPPQAQRCAFKAIVNGRRSLDEPLDGPRTRRVSESSEGGPAPGRGRGLGRQLSGRLVGLLDGYRSLSMRSDASQRATASSEVELAPSVAADTPRSLAFCPTELASSVADVIERRTSLSRASHEWPASPGHYLAHARPSPLSHGSALPDAATPCRGSRCLSFSGGDMHGVAPPSVFANTSAQGPVSWPATPAGPVLAQGGPALDFFGQEGEATALLADPGTPSPSVQAAGIEEAGAAEAPGPAGPEETVIRVACDGDVRGGEEASSWRPGAEGSEEDAVESAALLGRNGEGAAGKGGNEDDDEDANGESKEEPWWRSGELRTALAGYGSIAFIFNFLEELTPIFASAPLAQGGLALTTDQLAPAVSFSGAVLVLFALFIYPRLQARLGCLATCRMGLSLSIPMALCIPLASLATSRVLWIQAILLPAAGFKAVTSIMSLTSSIIQVNLAAPLNQIGTVNGAANTIAAGVRALGPLLGGNLWALVVAAHVRGQQFLAFGAVAIGAGAARLLYSRLRFDASRA